MFIHNRDALATTPARRLALEAVDAAIEAVLPGGLIAGALDYRSGVLTVSGQGFPVPSQGIRVLGAGKAATGMAAAVEAALPSALLSGGAVITVPGAAGPRPRHIAVLEGDHPVPGAASLEATARLLEEAGPPGEDVLYLWLISGGASALFCSPVHGLAFSDKQEAVRLLVHSGAAIDEINAVRKHLSAVKGGLLARRLAPARVLTLAISDVPSGRLDVIGSGPAVPDASTYGDALDVLDRYDLGRDMPPAVVRHLEEGAAGLLPETPKPGDPCFGGGVQAVLGSPGVAAGAAAAAARCHPGVHAEILTDQVAGEARSVAATLGAILRYWAGVRPDRTQVIVAAGETTVAVSGHGRGGRCQELAAALVPELDGLPRCAVVCAASDGQDYLPGAGGAIVDGDTAALARSRGLRVQQHLREHDSNALHRALGTLLETGPTGTNVCDLVIAVLNAGPGPPAN